MTERQTTDFPTGSAYVERVGWEEDEEHGRRFTATLVFPHGPPDLGAAIVWRRQAVRIEVDNA